MFKPTPKMGGGEWVEGFGGHGAGCNPRVCLRFRVQGFHRVRGRGGGGTFFGVLITRNPTLWGSILRSPILKPAPISCIRKPRRTTLSRQGPARDAMIMGFQTTCEIWGYNTRVLIKGDPTIWGGGPLKGVPNFRIKPEILNPQP